MRWLHSLIAAHPVTSGIPAAGAYIGKAVSAQATVGSAVDVLTKFQ